MIHIWNYQGVYLDIIIKRLRSEGWLNAPLEHLLPLASCPIAKDLISLEEPPSDCVYLLSAP